MIKGQALADFIVEFTYSNVVEVTGMADGAEAIGVMGREDSVPTEEDAKQWNLYVDNTSNNIELHGENFKEGSIPIGLVGTSAAFQISRMKFLQGGENVKTHFLKG